MWFTVITFVLALLALLLGLANVLAIGGIYKDYLTFKEGVRRMAEVADGAFAGDRKRIFDIEKFLVVVFKLDELLGVKIPGVSAEDPEPKLQDNIPSPKKGDLKN